MISIVSCPYIFCGASKLCAPPPLLTPNSSLLTFSLSLSHYVRQAPRDKKSTVRKGRWIRSRGTTLFRFPVTRKSLMKYVYFSSVTGIPGGLTSFQPSRLRGHVLPISKCFLSPCRSSLYFIHRHTLLFTAIL